MPTIPWMPGAAAGAAPADAGQAVVMASKLQVTSLLHVPRFFLLSLVVWKQVRSAPGVIGASLRAEPLKKTFWTLSAWSDQESLDRFSRSDPHARIVGRLRKVMDRSVFVFYPVGREKLPVAWDDAVARLADKEAGR
ncbi:hypothetical protein EDE04_7288 [Streptomyces sp. 2132.2]|uniref:DUF3291 domain-containing protein n=1 Tax=Streptomyces TaxID=1883 RepID=UPI000C4FD562|nr:MULTISPECIES: DUF3291 domain-containing protein [Streptomyces]ROQ88896.1 hypothetical protein EDE04_7288 [Streptomyces sp. 2132.2]GHE43904.1 hypothetical protein GCM10017778_29320 [Streptomyces vinaceus]